MLIFTPWLQDEIKKMVTHAHENPVTYSQLKEMLAGVRPSIGTSHVQHTLHLPVGFRVVYSEEQQPSGLYRHLSISSVGKGQPPIIACNMILKEFFFRNHLIENNPVESIKKNEFMFWFEAIGEGCEAVNFVERY
jgi:hypothetical protein